MKIIRTIIETNRKITEQGCWEWQGYSRRGYGAMSIKGAMIPAHRVAYEAWVGDIPDGLIVRHKCDNPRCVNYEHLELGTTQDNIDDIHKRGRGVYRSGVDNGNCKLTEPQLKEIVDLAKDGVGHEEISKKYGISRSCVSRWARLHGLTKNPRRISASEKRDILFRIKNGDRINDIAKFYGVSRGTIDYYKKLYATTETGEHVEVAITEGDV